MDTSTLIDLDYVFQQTEKSGYSLESVLDILIHMDFPSDEDVIVHYASKYYDPVKAHEYYMRARELKGRRRSSELNEEGKEIWRIAKSGITEEKRQKLEEARESRRIKMEALREDARVRREKITVRLREILRSISDKKKKDLEKERSKLKKKKESEQKEIEKKKKEIQTTLQSDISKEEERRKREITSIDSEIATLLNEDYTRLPNAQRIRKQEERKEKLAKLQGDKVEISTKSTDTISSLKEKAKENLVDVSEKSKKDKVKIAESNRKKRAQIGEKATEVKRGERNTASKDKEAIRVDLKTSLNTVGEAYKVASEKIKTDTEVNFQREFDAIKSQYGKDQGESSGGGYTPVKRSAAERKKIRTNLYGERTKNQ